MHYAVAPRNPKHKSRLFLLGYLVDSVATLMYDKQHQRLSSVYVGIYGLFGALVLRLARNRSALRIPKYREITSGGS